MDRKRSRTSSSSQALTLVPMGRTLRRTNSMARRVPRPISTGANTVHKFTRTIPILFNLNQLSTRGFIDSSAVSQSRWIAFNYTLAGVNVVGLAGTVTYALPNVADFSSLFDSYKIDKVEITMIAATNVAAVTSPTLALPTIWLFNDANSGERVSNASDFLEHENLRVVSFGANNIQRHTVYPKLMLGSGSISGSAANQWSNMSTTNIEYFGTKLFYDAIGQNSDVQVGSIEFLVKYHFSMKGVK